MNSPSPYEVAAFYHFATMADPATTRDALEVVARKAEIVGTILVAPEGVNGTIAGSANGISKVLEAIRALPGLANLTHKTSQSAERPFRRLKVRLKKEIVTLGVPDLNPSENAGTYVKPEAWNALITDPDVVVIDTRNDYEVGLGTFKGAVNPETQAFGELPGWLDANADALAGKKVAMFCTGGIRCEKSTALMRHRGFDTVYHLEGGILKYLEQVPEAESEWEGECFVFDERVSVGHGLVPGPYELCRGCRHPVGDAERASPTFQAGVSCPACHDQSSDEQKARFAERQRQMDLAVARGDIHLAPPKDAP